MPLSHMIIHRLTLQGDNSPGLLLASDVAAPSALDEQLFQQLRASLLGRVNRKHGCFSTDETPSSLAQALGVYLNDQSDFERLSADVMKQIAAACETLSEPLDYFFIFADEKTPTQHVFYMFLASLNQALSIGNDLSVVQSYSVDTGASLCGIKVDISEWQADAQYAYITLLTPRGNPALSEVLDTLVGLGESVNKEESTLNFLEGIESYVQHLPEDKVAEYRHQVVSYCMEQDERDEPVNISGLSKTLPGVEADHFQREMTQYQPPGERDVLIDRRSLRKYVKFFGRDKDLSLSFSTFHLNKRVHYDAEHDVLTIEGLPKSLRSQLHKHNSVR